MTPESALLYRTFCRVTHNTPFAAARYPGLAETPTPDEERLITIALRRAAAGQAPQPTTGLQSIFTRLLTDSGKQGKPLPLLPLSFEDAFLYPDTRGIDLETYRRMFVSACQDSLKPVESDFDLWFDRVLNLISVFGVRYPCGYQGSEDVSLYDFLRAALAFAVCAFRSPDSQSDTFRFVGGDLSGIQKYIYDITSRKAARNLKGRSFYLHILVDSVIRQILQEFQLAEFQVIYASGGGFYLIAPEDDRFDERFSQLRNRVADELFDTHHTRLFLALDSVSVPYEWVEKNSGAQLAECWKQLSQKLNQQKRCRYLSRIQNSYADFFEPLEVGGLTERDDITGEELTGKPWCLNREDDPAEHLFVSRNTYDNLRLADHLFKARRWEVRQRSSAQSSDDGSFPILDFEYRFGEGQRPADTSAVRTYTINEPEFWKSHAQGFQVYGGNNVPRDSDYRPKGFDELVGETGGFKRLGVLRMDVDNLGDIFIRGFDKGIRSFARYHALSRQLDYFFKGYLNTIWKQDEYRNHSTIIYSGGDDLFIVGQWDRIISMAQEIQKKFRIWVQGNDKLTLSGGLALVKNKFPIARAAQLAEHLEKQAKDYKCNV
jgi:CRISPR-associated protein Csm1